MRRRRQSGRGEGEEEESTHLSNGSVKERRREEGRKGNQIKVVKISSIAWLCLGMVLGTVFVTMKYYINYISYVSFKVIFDTEQQVYFSPKDAHLELLGLKICWT